MPTQSTQRGQFRSGNSFRPYSGPKRKRRPFPSDRALPSGHGSEAPVNSETQPENREPIENGFTPFGITQFLLRKLASLGVNIPTPIQSQTIPSALDGHDLIGIAETGTGKTLAFALPICMNLQAGQMALILAPTRELAEQISDTFVKLGRKPILLIGGAHMGRQIQDLRRRQDIIVATPGRLLDHMDRGTVYLDTVSTIVLDEADRMLDLGFSKAIQEILECTPEDRQTMLFSATFPRSIEDLAMRYLVDPIEVRVSTAGSAPELINQELVYVKHEDKPDIYAQLLDAHEGSVLVFSRTRHGARKLAKATRDLGHTAAEMHSDRTLAQRRDALNGFKSGEHRILVATDIAARGIDVKDISLVVNYDLPDNPEDYVHRIGRTGRAGANGKAVTLATPEQLRDVKGIEKVVRKEIDLSPLSLEAPADPRNRSANSGGPKPKSGFRRNRFRGR